jgi:hypothetical protein
MTTQIHVTAAQILTLDLTPATTIIEAWLADKPLDHQQQVQFLIDDPRDQATQQEEAQLELSGLSA